MKTSQNSIKLLGTGTSVGVPMIGCLCNVCQSDNPKDKRLRTSALVTLDDQKILIDVGPDVRTQLLTHSVRTIDAILVTHSHRDHVAGFDDIRAFNFLYQKKIPLYANIQTWDSIRKQFYYAFDNKDYTSLPEVEYIEIDSDTIQFSGNQIDIISVLHGNMTCLGFRFGKMAYITDCSCISDATCEQLMDLDVLILNSLRLTPHHSHFSLEESLAMIQRLSPKKAYLIHLSHHMGLHSEVSKLLPSNVFLGYDGLDIEF